MVKSRCLRDPRSTSHFPGDSGSARVCCRCQKRGWGLRVQGPCWLSLRHRSSEEGRSPHRVFVLSRVPASSRTPVSPWPAQVANRPQFVGRASREERLLVGHRVVWGSSWAGSGALTPASPAQRATGDPSLGGAEPSRRGPIQPREGRVARRAGLCLHGHGAHGRRVEPWGVSQGRG